ncbi:MAG: Flp pilus assembly protein CpaB [Pseudomonadota bacterium]|nr:Flp pilus assembly protein CpaB [Pseudomonadota bacterium]
MDKKKLILLLGAMIIAVGSALAVRSVLLGHTTPVTQAASILTPSGPRVLVAQRGLPVGTIITADAVGFQPWPRDMVQDAYFIETATDKAKLIGTVVRNPITAGQPLTQGALVAPGDRGFLAAALGRGMRAVTIPVSDMSGVAGFIFPGDHVDMMLTQTVKNNDPQNPNALPLSLTETILRNLRVLATDQTTETEVTPTGKSVVKTAHNVTLEVSPRVGEKIEVAQTLGGLSLALRALADDQGEFDRTMASGGSFALGGARNAANPGQKLPGGTRHGPEPMAYGANVSVEGATTYSTGGDVSRFARRSLARPRPAPRDGMQVNPGQANPGPFAATPIGPTIRIARGNIVSAEPIGNNVVIRFPGFPGMGGQSDAVPPMSSATVGGE